MPTISRNPSSTEGGDPLWGRVTTVQSDVLRLCGAVAGRGHRERWDRQARREMEEGLSALRQATGCDFGFDLRAWHRFLVGSPLRAPYTYPPTWTEVRAALRDAIRSPGRAQFVEGDRARQN